MLARRINDVLTLRSIDGHFVRDIDLGGLRRISSLRIDPSARWIALTAVSGTGREPDVRAGERGDLRLHVIEVGSGQRRVLTKSYAHDATWWPDASRIAFHTGQGIAIVGAEDGREEHRFDGGHFGWGPPSISVSPSGGHVAFVKWKGDDRKLAVYDLGRRAGQVLRPSCLHYAWWAEHRIAYDHGHSIHTVDTETGRTTLWLRRASDIAETETLYAAVPGAREILAERTGDRERRPVGFTHALLVERIVDQVKHPVLNVDGRVYFLLFIAQLAEPEQRVAAVLSLTARKRGLQVRAVVEGSRMLRGFVLLNEGRTIAVAFERYEGTTIAERGVFYVGEGAESIPEGFRPLPRRATPQFGFHAIPI